ncbi:MAG: Flp pilus assembly complex ATPase component TadA [Deltaproteobacteria bacterium]|nr:Flp pilus assembly complex ATPase component TadA [Deltaproteobacteria bacterium]MBZ0219811.1 GspE/PulE family protein [Deltaproteobacteria bacterium]
MKRLGEILVLNWSVSNDDIEKALAYSKEQGVRFGDACLRLGIIGESELAAALAEQYGLEFMEIEGAEVDDEILEKVPAEMLHKARLIPIRKGFASVLAVSDPTDLAMLDRIDRRIKDGGGKPVGIAIAAPSRIEKLLKGLGSQKMLSEAAGQAGVTVKDLRDEGDEVLSIERSSESSPAVRLVDTVLYDAIQKRASDIHLETGHEGLVVRYRIDGVLHRVMDPIEKSLSPSVVSRLKVMASLDISERRIPQDGRFKVRLRAKAIDFRLSIMPSVFGEDAVIRILDKEHIANEFEELRLESLGFNGVELARMRKMIREPYGMFLATGPTGSGKTTTLYAALSEINTGENKIITIEDPVEYELPGVVQIQVNEKKGLTFARGLRSILRHDPDKVLVGEIRDPETAQIAIQAALTGHLVFTSVHANNVFDVIGRFIHMGIEPYNFVSALNCIIAQRLVRIICPDCRVKADADLSVLLESGIDPERCSVRTMYEGAGCQECHNTGYRGRKAIVEILDLTDEIRDMIAGKEPISQIRKKAIDGGMKTLRQSAVEKVLSGETTLREINRVTFME